MLDEINMLDEIFSEINKGVVLNKEVGRKCQLIQISSKFLIQQYILILFAIFILQTRKKAHNKCSQINFLPFIYVHWIIWEEHY